MENRERKISFRISDDFYQEIMNYINEKDISLSTFIRLAIMDTMDINRQVDVVELLDGKGQCGEIEELKRNFEVEKLSMEVRLQTLRAEKAECQVELERLKAENERLKMDAIYREALQHAQNRINMDSKLKSEEKSQSMEQSSEETADYYADESEMFYY